MSRALSWVSFISYFLFCSGGKSNGMWLRFGKVYGEYVNGSISDEERKKVLKNSCPGAGACGGMYTANTMATAIETLGMSLPYRYLLSTSRK